MLIDHVVLTDIVRRICEAARTPEAEAHAVATHLVDANLKGHDSHGVGMLPAYIRNIAAGHLIPTNHAELVADNGANLIVDGRFGFGQVVGPEAIDMGLERAARFGIASVALRNAHHLGRIGALGERCANAGFISMHYVNVVGHDPLVAPFWGREARMGTNPYCCAIPVPGGEPIVLDMATSAIAAGKVRVALATEQQVPEGSLLDHEGVETRDPRAFFTAPRGSLAHFGRHKGYGLALICELLAGGLAGGWTAQPGNPREGSIVNHMLAFILDPAAVGDRALFEHETLAMIHYLKSCAPAEGVPEVLIAGEPERIAQATRTAEGIFVDDNTWEAIVQTAQAAGLKPEDVDPAVPRPES